MRARRACAFGVSMTLDPGVDLIGVSGEVDGGKGRECLVRLVPAGEIEEAWGQEAGELLREERHPDGDLLLTLHHRPGVGYRLDAPFHGRFFVGVDGHEVLCCPSSPDRAGWQHVLLGQLVPLAATLQGLELFHAGGVSVEGAAALFCASSGTGKSSLIARLVKQGPSLLADDAVAVEVTPDGVALAHPGPGLVHLFPDDAAGLAESPGPALDRVAGYRMAKVALAASRATGPARIANVYMLERGGSGDQVSISPLRGDPMRLLAATTLPVVNDPDRLRRHFEICSTLAETVPMHLVRAPDGATREALAQSVLTHLRSQ